MKKQTNNNNQKIGKGKNLEDIMTDMNMIAEGIKSAISVESLRRKFGIEMPICSAVYDILFNKKDPKKAVYDLMKRKLKVEN